MLATGSTETLKTPTQGGNLNPTWNDYLVFTSKEWKKIAVRVMDDMMVMVESLTHSVIINPRKSL
jgi:hypothetical protein